MTSTHPVMAFLLTVVGVCFDALLLSLACRIVLGRFPVYTRAALVTAISYAALGVCDLVATAWLPLPIGLGGACVLSFALAVLATRWLLRTREGARMSVAKAGLVQLLNVAFNVLLGIAFMLLLAAMMWMGTPGLTDKLPSP